MKSFLIEEAMLERVRKDLTREIPPELDAYERVGFLFVRSMKEGAFAPSFYMPILDEEYLNLPVGYGAYYGERAINRAIMRILETDELVYTIHAHSGIGEPIPSRPDLMTEAKLIDCFSRIKKGHHGSVILSEDSILVRMWQSELKAVEKVKVLEINKTIGGKK